MAIALKLMKKEKSQSELSGIIILERKGLYHEEDIHCN